jgi:hypothetical protein
MSLTTRPIAILAACAASLFVGSLGSSARADDKAACVSAYEDAQTLRSKGQLRGAHEKLLVCAAQTCPKVVLDQCAGWLDEVEKAMPTVNFAVTDENGKDLADVAVSFDGAPLKSSLDGKAIAVDPGKHNFRFDAPGRKPIELMVVVREGEKARVIDATWKGVAPLETPKAGPHEGGAGGGAEPSGGRKLSPAFWVLGGAGVVGLGLFATFGGLGLSQKSKDAGAGGCAPRCSDSEVSSIKTKFVVADVSLAVGLASLAGAGVFGIVALTSKPSAAPPAKASSLTFTAAPTLGGGYVGLSGRF